MSGTDRSEHGGISAPCPLAAALVDGGEPKDPRYSWVGLELIPDAVPEGLKAIEQWVPWKAVPRVGRPGMDKVPYQTNGAKAKSSDPSTWSDWNSVLKCLESDGDEPSEYSGPGFMFRAENGLIGLDWDHVRDPGTGVIDEVAAAAIAYIGGYSEVSPSGTGVRVIGRGTLASAITSATLQGWSSGRFVTVTGHRLPGSSADIQDIDPVRLAEIVDYYAPAKPAPSQAIAGACQDLDVQQVLEIRAALGHLPVDNYPLMIEMGMCLHSTGARNAFGIWNEWCLASDKYDGLKAKRAKWAGFGRDAEGVQLRTLFFRAAEHGWVNPASRQAVAFAAATPGPATAALGKPAGAPGARETPQKGLSADEGAELLNHLDQSGRATPAYSWPKVSLGSGNYTAPFLSIAAECGLDGFLRGLEEYLPRRAATVERSHAAALAKGQPITPDMPEDEIREQAAAWLERVRTLQVSDERGRALLERVRAGVTAEDVPLEVAEVTDDSNVFPEPPPALYAPLSGSLRLLFDHYMASSRYPQPLFGLASACATVAAVMGRSYRFQSLFANVMAVMVGPTGCGKEAPQQLADAALTAAGLGARVGPGSIVSGAGVEDHMEQCPVTLWLLDELGKMLGAVSQTDQGRAADIAARLMQFYTKSGGIYRGRALAGLGAGAVKTILNPFCVVLGATTPEAMRSALSAGDAESGFTGRLLFFATSQMRPTRQTPVSTIEEVPQAFIDWARVAGHESGYGDLPPGGPVAVAAVNVQSSPEAQALLDRYGAHVDARLEKLRDPTARSGLVRAFETACKFVLIAAVSDAPVNPIIEARHAQWGVAMAEHLAATFTLSFAERMGSDRHFDALLRLRSIIFRARDFADARYRCVTQRGLMPRSYLIKLGKMRSTDLDELLTTLFEMGEVSSGVATKDRHGLSGTVYWATAGARGDVPAPPDFPPVPHGSPRAGKS